MTTSHMTPPQDPAPARPILPWSVVGLVIAMAAMAEMAVVPTVANAQTDAPAAATETLPGLAPGQTVAEEARHVPLFDVDGHASDMDALAAKEGLMLIFSANTCPYVVDWLDRLPRLASQGRRHGIAVVVVNANERKRNSTDSPADMAALWNERGYGMPYLVDRDATLADALGAQRTPEVFLFDGSWRLVYRGAIDDLSGPFEEVTVHYALEALQGMVSGDGVVLESTPALGCAIQRPRRRARKPVE